MERIASPLENRGHLERRLHDRDKIQRSRDTLGDLRVGHLRVAFARTQSGLRWVFAAGSFARGIPVPEEVVPRIGRQDMVAPVGCVRAPVGALDPAVEDALTLNPNDQVLARLGGPGSNPGGRRTSEGQVESVRSVDCLKCIEIQDLLDRQRAAPHLHVERRRRITDDGRRRRP